MAEFEVMQIHLSDGAIVHRLKELVIEYEQLKAYWDDRRKGRRMMERATIDMACEACGSHSLHLTQEGKHCIACSNCKIKTPWFDSFDEAAACWDYFNAYTPKVTAACVTKIAAAVPEGRTLEPNICDVELYRTYKTESVGSGESSQNVPDDASRVSISFAFRDEPLTGQAWAAKQEPGTMFEIDGVVWFIGGCLDGFRRIYPAIVSTKPSPYTIDGRKWENWPDCLDPVSDAHIIHRPKGGE